MSLILHKSGKRLNIRATYISLDYFQTGHFPLFLKFSFIFSRKVFLKSRECPSPEPDGEWPWWILVIVLVIVGCIVGVLACVFLYSRREKIAGGGSTSAAAAKIEDANKDVAPAEDKPYLWM